MKDLINKIKLSRLHHSIIMIIDKCLVEYNRTISSDYNNVVTVYHVDCIVNRCIFYIIDEEVVLSYNVFLELGLDSDISEMN